MTFRRIDHVRFFVGNARQSAYFYRNAFGFDVVGYAGLETGVRHEASYVLRQGEITFVLVSPLSAEHPENSRLLVHGDGVQDLAIEVDVSPSKIDRPAIYAALRVAELWRFDGERKRPVIERLSEDGTYQTVDMSEFLPVRSEEVARWVLEEDRRAGSAWGRRLRAWARAELALRLPR